MAALLPVIIWMIGWSIRIPAPVQNRGGPELRFVAVVANGSGGLADDRMVDVEVSRNGTVFAARASGWIIRLTPDPRTRLPMKADSERFDFHPTALASDSNGDLWVFGSASSVLLLDENLHLVARRDLPVVFAGIRSAAFTPSGDLAVSGYNLQSPFAQIHLFCKEMNCIRYSIKEGPSFRHWESNRVFPGGILNDDREKDGGPIYYASPQVHSIFRLVRGQTGKYILKPIALPDSTWLKGTNVDPLPSNAEPTGIVPIGKDILYTVFSPGNARTTIVELTPNGETVGAAHIPSDLRVEAILSRNQFLVLRYAKRQQLAVYEIAEP